MKLTMRKSLNLCIMICPTSEAQFAGKLIIIVLGLATSISGACCAQADQQHFAARKKLWQEELENRPFVFLKKERGLINSLELYSTTCQLNIVVDPLPEDEQQNYRMSLKFVREGKEVLNLPGDTESIFRAVDEKLYVADVQDQGCIVSAYDLADGRQLWATEDVSQLRRAGASAYSNQVQMRLSRPNEISDEPEAAALIITGKEGFGEYIAVLDRETGAMLAHKIYGTGFFEPRPIEDRRSGGRRDPRAESR